METMQYDSPDEEIFAYIAGNYSPEYGEDLKAALSLLYGFRVADVQDTLCELIYDVSKEDTDAHRVEFSNFIQNAVIALISQHGLDLQDSRLDESVQVLSALLQVQNCEDPVPYLRVLELNTIDNEDKVVRVLKDFCALDEGKLYTIIAYVSDTLPMVLYTRLLELEQRNCSEQEDEDVVTPEVVHNFRQFEQCFGPESFGHVVLKSGMQVGLPFRLYVAYINHGMPAEPTNYALDIFSLLLLASDTYNRPVAAFREYAEILIDDPSAFQRVETELQKLNEKFEQFKKEPA